jgi:hypothetical protein
MPGAIPPFPLFRNCRFDHVWKTATQGQLIGNRSHAVSCASAVLIGNKCYCWLNIRCHRKAVKSCVNLNCSLQHYDSLHVVGDVIKWTSANLQDYRVY